MFSRLFLIISVFFLASCSTIEKRAGCDLPPLPDKAFLWWDIDGNGLTVMSAVPEEMREKLEMERNAKGAITAIYLNDESKRIIEEYAACLSAGQAGLSAQAGRAME